MPDALTRGINPLLIVAALALAIYALFGASPYGFRVLTVAGVYAIAVIGYQTIFGQAGALSLAQGTFFGLGAYVTGILGSKFGFGFPVTFPLSILVPTLLALLIAVPVLRLESHYFALATLGIGQVILLAAIEWQSLTGGANGIAGVPGIELFGWRVGRGLPLAVSSGRWSRSARSSHGASATAGEGPPSQSCAKPRTPPGPWASTSTG